MSRNHSFRVVIPARYASSRLPAKPLADIAGKPMIQWVYEQSLLSRATDVWVATDDQRVYDVVSAFGGRVLMTSAEHLSGTDRLAEVADLLNWDDDDILVNVQGDEPMIPVSLINQVADNLACHTDAAAATLCEPIHSVDEFLNENVVKVVFDDTGMAHYFSRAAIPYSRQDSSTLRHGQALPASINAFRHLGIYAYRSGTVRRFVCYPPAPLEKTESLEQLRLLANKDGIHVAIAAESSPAGVDTQDDLNHVRSLLSAKN